MKIREIFTTDVTRDIPPVIYFHERDPKKLQAELSEYIVTGGYPEGHPLHDRVPRGIHEEYVKLLQAVKKELGKPNGPELPAAWISGFYGSGKSGFAKLLGCALDHVTLPDGRAVSDALIARDRSPLKGEFQESWDDLSKDLDSLACIFDIGGSARDNEHIHTVIVRMVQARLGYCNSPAVARDEVKLEQSGEWPRFLEVAQETLGRPWSEACQDHFAKEDFSEIMHAFQPDRYIDPMSWFDVKAGFKALDVSPNEAVEAISQMIDFRQSGKTLFIVIDEISQYIHQDEGRMLKLQSFVSALGQKLRGQAWLVVTGQQKLEHESEATTLGKLKDRFPPNLRIHLGLKNIRDVVHRRLLEKKDEHKAALEALFKDYRQNLHLFAYECADISKDDFLEVYPMLPEHVELLLQITTALKDKSSRVQGDAYAIRGLLQLLGDLFRDQKLADKEVGELITLEHIYELQASSLDSDIQLSLSRIEQFCQKENLIMAQRVAKVVSLLQLIQEKKETSADLVARCLYDRLDRGSIISEVTEALELLRRENLLSHSEKRGYRIQSSAGAEWERERKEIKVTADARSLEIQKTLKELIGNATAPRYKGVAFRWKALYSDQRRADDEVLQNPRNDTSLTIDFRFRPSSKEKNPEDQEWLGRSAEEKFKERIVWLLGSSEALFNIAGELQKSRQMVAKQRNRDGLNFDRQRLLQEENNRAEDYQGQLERSVKESWLGGKIFFQGSQSNPRDISGAFKDVLLRTGETALPTLFPHFVSTAVKESEILELIGKDLSGLSSKFLSGDIGLFTKDEGKFVPTCPGAAPSAIFQFVEASAGSSGETLFNRFQAPPYGFSPALIRACIAGLLRGGRIKIKTEKGSQVTSVRDEDAKELFTKDRPLRRADIFPAGEGVIKPRERNRICKFFRDVLKMDIERDNEAIADAVYDCFPGQSAKLRNFERLYKKLPGRNEIPESFQNLALALDECRRSRQIVETVSFVRGHLVHLRDGLKELGIDDSELNEDKVCQLNKVSDRLRFEKAQLEAVGLLPESLKELSESMEKQIHSDRPWRCLDEAEASGAKIRETYIEVRGTLLKDQQQRIEQAREKMKRRSGFESLNADQAHGVLRHLSACLTNTDEEAVAPALSELSDPFRQRLNDALVLAHEHFDKFLSENDKPKVVTIELDITHRVVKDDKDLDALLSDIRGRIKDQLEKGHTIRLT